MRGEQPGTDKQHLLPRVASRVWGLASNGAGPGGVGGVPSKSQEDTADTPWGLPCGTQGRQGAPEPGEWEHQSPLQTGGWEWTQLRAELSGQVTSQPHTAWQLSKEWGSCICSFWWKVGEVGRPGWTPCEPGAVVTGG